MSATPTASWTLPLVALDPETELPVTGPATLTMPVVAAAQRPTPAAPDVTVRLPRRNEHGLVLTGQEQRGTTRYAWLLDATASPLGPTTTGSVLADAQEMLRGTLAGLTVLEAMTAAHRYLAAGTTSGQVPISAALLREHAGVLEVAVMGSATARMTGREHHIRTVTCRRPHRTMLETIGVQVELTIDELTGRVAELEVTRTRRTPRASVPVLGAATGPMGRPGYGVSAAHLLELVELRAAGGLFHGPIGALLPRR